MLGTPIFSKTLIAGSSMAKLHIRVWCELELHATYTGNYGPASLYDLVNRSLKEPGVVSVVITPIEDKPRDAS